MSDHVGDLLLIVVIALLLMGCTNDERFSGAPSSRGVAQAYEPACYDASNKAVWDLGQATPFATSFTPINRIVLADSGVAGVGNVRVLRLNGTGQALIVDTPNRDLKWIDLPSGDVTHVIGRSGRGPGEFRAPFDASITPSGRILVADPEVGRISLFTTDGEYLEEFAITHQDPRIIIAHSDSDYSVIGQSGAGRDEHMVVRYTGGRQTGAHLQMDPFVKEIDLIVDAPWAVAGAVSNDLFTGMAVRPIVVRLASDGTAICRFVVPPGWNQLSVQERQGQTLQDTRSWIQNASIINGAVYSTTLGLVLSYGIPVRGGRQWNIIALNDDLSSHGAWSAIPGRLLAASGDSLFFLEEDGDEQKLSLLIYRYNASEE